MQQIWRKAERDAEAEVAGGQVEEADAATDGYTKKMARVFLRKNTLKNCINRVGQINQKIFHMAGQIGNTLGISWGHWFKLKTYMYLHFWKICFGMTALFNIRLIACGFVPQGMYLLKHSRFESWRTRIMCFSYYSGS